MYYRLDDTSEYDEIDIRNYLNKLKKDPNNVEICWYLYHAYIENELPDKALDICLRIKELDPDTPGLYINLGLAYAKLHDFNCAIECYHIALMLYPEEKPGIYLNLGNVYRERGKIQLAQEYYEKALEHGVDKDIIDDSIDILNSIRPNKNDAAVNAVPMRTTR